MLLVINSQPGKKMGMIKKKTGQMIFTCKLGEAKRSFNTRIFELQRIAASLQVKIT